jgi:hypothetical protein
VQEALKKKRKSPSLESGAPGGGSDDGDDARAYSTGAAGSMRKRNY